MIERRHHLCPLRDVMFGWREVGDGILNGASVIPRHQV
jgi:hypothetical protein